MALVPAKKRYPKLETKARAPLELKWRLPLASDELTNLIEKQPLANWRDFVAIHIETKSLRLRFERDDGERIIVYLPHHAHAEMLYDVGKQYLDELYPYACYEIVAPYQKLYRVLAKDDIKKCKLEKGSYQNLIGHSETQVFVEFRGDWGIIYEHSYFEEHVKPIYDAMQAYLASAPLTRPKPRLVRDID